MAAEPLARQIVARPVTKRGRLVMERLVGGRVATVARLVRRLAGGQNLQNLRQQ